MWRESREAGGTVKGNHVARIFYGVILLLIKKHLLLVVILYALTHQRLWSILGEQIPYIKHFPLKKMNFILPLVWFPPPIFCCLNMKSNFTYIWNRTFVIQTKKTKQNWTLNNLWWFKHLFSRLKTQKTFNVPLWEGWKLGCVVGWVSNSSLL